MGSGEHNKNVDTSTIFDFSSLVLQPINMKSAFAVVFATFAALAAAAPLNINLGAYSPALVVGDGAIGFNGAEGEAATNGAAALEGQGIASK
ncbi:hypothetical protein F4805DRAFT_458522 [Annulohypoxylon moriforme]|nr:hypothetical protein F4805DRAFT_458522 [Annulohypoxylon moriforme]